ncbi:hypothetical protein ACFWB0_02895 [Rhodococcus sp. NPDC060086]|uniref:hypothetical protein n=1 Tax=Rhodococcus sp. NPDC060086 TaxID=3347055 RepID=UPI003655924B
MTAPTTKKRGPGYYGYQAARGLRVYLNKAEDQGWPGAHIKAGGVWIDAEFAEDGDLLLQIEGGPTQRLEFEDALEAVRQAAIAAAICRLTQPA